METLRNATEINAKKNHVCDLCREKIMAGSAYLKSTHVFDGRIYDFKSHGYCNELANKLKMYDSADEGLTGDAFMEIISETHDSMLIDTIPKKDIPRFSNIIQQIRKVSFKNKLWFVIRQLKK